MACLLELFFAAKALDVFRSITVVLLLVLLSSDELLFLPGVEMILLLADPPPGGWTFPMRLLRLTLVYYSVLGLSNPAI